MIVYFGLFSLLFMQQGGNMIKLPDPQFTHSSIEECIGSRRSIRSYSDKALTQEEISSLLWAGQGITEKGRGFRTAPSAGATYPLEILYASAEGLYRYMPKSHSVKKVKNGDIRNDIAKAALNQMFIADAGMVIVIAAVYNRTTWRYGDRGIRYVYMEVGHCAQNIHLEAVALGLGSVPIGAFNDDDISDLLELDEEEPLYIIPVGHSE